MNQPMGYLLPQEEFNHQSKHCPVEEFKPGETNHLGILLRKRGGS
jgi:hypothetical protein